MADSAVSNADFSLAGRSALVTGAAQGIGNAIAELFASKGADLVLVDLKEDVRSAGKDLEGRTGRTVLPIVADLTQAGEVERIVEEAIGRFGRIDILVNNAGIVLLEDAEKLPEDYWDRTMAINLKAPFMLAQAVGRRMMRDGGGKIINLASQAGLIALDRHVAYCTSKAGIIGMTKVLAYEWGEYHVNVNAISPTVVLTELGRKAWAGDVGEAMKRKIPIGRFAQPEEIAGVALFLASRAADMITGENVVIDGGYTIQ